MVCARTCLKSFGIIIALHCLTSIRHVSGTSIQHYTCADKERCSDLMTVYDKDEDPLYQRAMNETILECDGKTPVSGTCTVCREQDIYIICPADTVPKDAEDSEGNLLTLEKVPPPTVKQPGYYYCVFISIFGIAVVVMAAVFLYRRCWKR